MLGVFLPWNCLSAFLVFFGLILDTYIVSAVSSCVCGCVWRKESKCLGGSLSARRRTFEKKVRLLHAAELGSEIDD